MPGDAIVRDIARLVTVAQMVHDGELNELLVRLLLAGKLHRDGAPGREDGAGHCGCV